MGQCDTYTLRRPPWCPAAASPPQQGRECGGRRSRAARPVLLRPRTNSADAFSSSHHRLCRYPRRYCGSCCRQAAE
eukprot:scaffold1970_cov396-Prasinococcus_capsulatus_cf.AAC.25